MLDFPQQRRNDLDWVRILAFALLVPFHVGMYYVSWDWHVKSPMAGPTLEPFMILTAPWRLLLLFFISGVASAYLQAKAPNGFLFRRLRRLWIPLLFGMLVVVVPQAYYQVMEKLPGGYHQGYLAFWWQYLSGFDGFCDASDCLDVPTWNHLWFLAYLLVYTLALPLARFWPSRWFLPGLAGVGALLWPVVFLVAARLMLLERFESTHALWGDWYNHAQYFSAFLFGFAMAKRSDFWQALDRYRWFSTVLALCAAAVLFAYFSTYNEAQPAPEHIRLAQRALWGLQQWLVPAAIMGFAHRHWQGDSALLKTLNPAVFPLYILHQTVIVVLAHNLKPMAIRPLLEGPVLILSTFVICWSAYLLIRRIPWIGPVFGLAWKPRASRTIVGPRL